MQPVLNYNLLSFSFIRVLLYYINISFLRVLVPLYVITYACTRSQDAMLLSYHNNVENIF